MQKTFPQIQFYWGTDLKRRIRKKKKERWKFPGAKWAPSLWKFGTTLTTSLSRPETCKNRGGCQKDNHRHHQDLIWEWSELKLQYSVQYWEYATTARLQFSKQHLNESENMKGRFSGLIRQETDSLTWIPIAVSNRSQILLITIPAGTHGASTSSHIF